MTPTLADALTKEHTDIDAGIEAFTGALGGSDPGSELPTATMLDAIAAQRRHIYLEETMLFPPLRAGGMFAAILVMLREHGEMWRVMDELEPLLRDGGGNDAVPALCKKLVSLLEAHNSKEEATIYAKADDVLQAEVTGELRTFLGSGTMPDGWVCEQA